MMFNEFVPNLSISSSILLQIAIISFNFLICIFVYVKLDIYNKYFSIRKNSRYKRIAKVIIDDIMAYSSKGMYKEIETINDEKKHKIAYDEYNRYRVVIFFRFGEVYKIKVKNSVFYTKYMDGVIKHKVKSEVSLIFDIMIISAVLSVIEECLFFII